MTPLPKIIAHLADEAGCGFYRLITPGKTLQFFSKAEVLLVTAFLSTQGLEEQRPDICIFQRQTELIQAQEIGRYRKDLPHAKLIFEIDDLLWNAPPGNSYRMYFKGDQRKALMTGLKAVDKILTTTAPLKAELEQVSKAPVYILPNMISGQFFKTPEMTLPTRLRIGYAGSSSHEPDLRILEYVVKETREFADWVFLGYCPDYLKPYITEYKPGVKVQEYLPALKNMKVDVAVAPLLDNHFNACKSNLKLIEFGAIGIPVITSDVYPYKDNPGIKIKPHKKQWKDWIDAIKLYSEDHTRRFKDAQLTHLYADSFRLETTQNIKLIEKAWLT